MPRLADADKMIAVVERLRSKYSNTKHMTWNQIIRLINNAADDYEAKNRISNVTNNEGDEQL